MSRQRSGESIADMSRGKIDREIVELTALRKVLADQMGAGCGDVRPQ